MAGVLGSAARGARGPARARRLAGGVEYRDGLLPGSAAGGLRARPPPGQPHLAGRTTRRPGRALGRRGSHRADWRAPTPRSDARRPSAHLVAARDVRGRSRARVRRRVVADPARSGLARTRGRRRRVRRSLLSLLGLERRLRRRPARVSVPPRSIPRAGPAGIDLEHRLARTGSASPRPVVRGVVSPRGGGGRGRCRPGRSGRVAGGAHPRAGCGPERTAPRHHPLPDDRRGIGAAALDRAARALPRLLRPRLCAPRADSAASARSARGPGAHRARDRLPVQPHDSDPGSGPPSRLHPGRVVLPRRAGPSPPAAGRPDPFLPAGFDGWGNRRAARRDRRPARPGRRLRVSDRARSGRRPPPRRAGRPASRPPDRRRRRPGSRRRRALGDPPRVRRFRRRPPVARHRRDHDPRARGAGAARPAVTSEPARRRAARGLPGTHRGLARRRCAHRPRAHVLRRLPGDRGGAPARAQPGARHHRPRRPMDAGGRPNQTHRVLHGGEPSCRGARAHPQPLGEAG